MDWRTACVLRSATKKRILALSQRSRSSCGAMMIERLGPPLDEPIFDELAIIGVGLIGSSVARAVRRRKAARRIIVADRSAETLKRAHELDLGEEATDDL